MMVLRNLCGIALFTLCVPMACSDSDGDADGDNTAGGGGSSGSTAKGGAAGKGSGSSGDSSGGEPSGSSGTDGSGGEPGGSSGADGSGGEGTAGGGGAPALECAESDTTNTDCEVEGSVCQAADRCCRCIDFPGAPTCGSLWDCAEPANNMKACPENPPTSGTACGMIGLACQYCDADGPRHFFCGIVQVGSDEGEWNEGDGLSCSQ